jgi:adenylate kinase
MTRDALSRFGQGTQCDRIKVKYNYKHLSAGDLLREEVASGSGRGEEIKKLMVEGRLVPVGLCAFSVC